MWPKCHITQEVHLCNSYILVVHQYASETIQHQQWPAMTSIDQQWPAMTSSDQQWPAVTCNDQQWQAMTSIDQQWPTVTSNDQQWPAMTSKSNCQNSYAVKHCCAQINTFCCCYLASLPKEPHHWLQVLIYLPLIVDTACTVYEQ